MGLVRVFFEGSALLSELFLLLEGLRRADSLTGDSYSMPGAEEGSVAVVRGALVGKETTADSVDRKASSEVDIGRSVER